MFVCIYLGVCQFLESVRNAIGHSLAALFRAKIRVAIDPCRAYVTPEQRQCRTMNLQCNL